VAIRLPAAEGAKLVFSVDTAQRSRRYRMTTLFISSLLLITLLAGGAVVMIHRAYIHTIDGLRADNKDLRDRLFQKNALPPSGVDLTEKYEERQERIQASLGDRPMMPKQPKGPIEKLTAKWTEKDRTLVERKNIDATRGRLN
jgi:hypothetical protein